MVRMDATLPPQMAIKVLGRHNSDTLQERKKQPRAAVHISPYQWRLEARRAHADIPARGLPRRAGNAQTSSMARTGTVAPHQRPDAGSAARRQRRTTAGGPSTGRSPSDRSPPALRLQPRARESVYAWRPGGRTHARGAGFPGMHASRTEPGDRSARASLSRGRLPIQCRWPAGSTAKGLIARAVALLCLALSAPGSGRFDCTPGAGQGCTPIPSSSRSDRRSGG